MLLYLTCFLGVSFGVSVRETAFNLERKCILVIDGGSSSTKATAFQFVKEAEKWRLRDQNTPNWRDANLKLAQYKTENNLKQLEALIDQRIERTRAWDCANFEVLLGATAGVRRLEENRRKQVIKSVQKDLQQIVDAENSSLILANPFYGVLSPSEEAGYALIALNSVGQIPSFCNLILNMFGKVRLNSFFAFSNLTFY